VDFVVVGFGLGALGVLLGVVMLGWLAPRSQRAAALASSPDDAVRCQAIAAEHRGTGHAFLYSGGVMLLATVAGLVGSLDDRTGALLVATTATVAAVGILLAGYLQRARNPAPARRRTRSAPVSSASLVAPPLPGDIPSFLAVESPRDQDPEPMESDGEGRLAGVRPAGDPGGEATLVEELGSLPLAASGALSSGATDPGPLSDSPIAVETTDSRTWQPADHPANNGSGDMDLAESEDAENAGHVTPAARSTELTSSRPDEEDPSSGHQ
jgi:hypothetical protein